MELQAKSAYRKAQAISNGSTAGLAFGHLHCFQLPNTLVATEQHSFQPLNFLGKYMSA